MPSARALNQQTRDANPRNSKSTVTKELTSITNPGGRLGAVQLDLAGIKCKSSQGDEYNEKIGSNFEVFPEHKPAYLR